MSEHIHSVSHMQSNSLIDFYGLGLCYLDSANAPRCCFVCERLL